LKAIELLESETQIIREGKSEYLEEDYVNPIYYINLAVLYMKIEGKDEANEYLAKAHEALQNVQKLSPESMRLKAISVTLNFNEACQFEALGNIGEATNIYKHIINIQKREEPHYVDAYLRLAILAKQRGGIAKAIEYTEKAIRYQIDKKPVVPHCLLGTFYMSQKQYKDAEKEFMKAINKNPHDAYAYLSIGNIIYEHSCRKRDQNVVNTQRHGKVNFSSFYTYSHRQYRNSSRPCRGI
jgi:tetratricopeptide (TPR) repeat protein